jgi:hypothetical protein
MDLTRHVERLRRELAVVAAAGGDEAEALAERLTAALDSAVRLTLLDALSAATAEITSDLAPGSVHLRLQGQDPDFVVTLPPVQPTDEAPLVANLAPPEEATAERGEISRIHVRIADHLKARIEEAAQREGLSINAWLVRAIIGALDEGWGQARRGPQPGQRYSGWVR